MERLPQISSMPTMKMRSLDRMMYPNNSILECVKLSQKVCLPTYGAQRLMKRILCDDPIG